MLNTGTSTPSFLHFGVVDNFYPDNSGGYTIQVTQLAVAAVVPEPSSLILAGTASLLGLAYASRRRRGG